MEKTKKTNKKNKQKKQKHTKQKNKQKKNKQTKKKKQKKKKKTNKKKQVIDHYSKYQNYVREAGNYMFSQSMECTLSKKKKKKKKKKRGPSWPCIAHLITGQVRVIWNFHGRHHEVYFITEQEQISHKRCAIRTHRNTHTLSK